MAQAGYTPISLYYSATPAAAPAAGNLVAGELALNTVDGKLYFKNSSNVVTLLASSAGASGDVVGPASSTDNAIARFDLTTGKLIQNSGVTIDDSNNVSGVAQLNATTADLTNIEVTNIKAKDGTAAASIADSTGKITVSTELAVDNLNLAGNTLSSTDANGNVVIAPNGTGDVQLDADTVRIGDSNANATLTTNGTGDLILNTNSGTNSGSITIQDGVDGNIVIAPNGNGQVQITNAVIDTTTIEVTNIKAKDGTASMTIADSTGTVTYSAPAVFTAGTVSAPAITTTGDTNTGIFFPAADTIAFTEGGVEAMRIDSSGNVGIGVTPSAWDSIYKAIEGGDSNNQSLFSFRTDTNAAIVGANFYYGGSTNVYKHTGTAGLYAVTGNEFIWYNAPSGTGGTGITFTERMRIDPSGNVGIGTSSPKLNGNAGTFLTINNASANGWLELATGSTSDDIGGAITFNNTNVVGTDKRVAQISSGRAGANNSAYLAFNTWNAGTGAERMRIDSSGNVGIGTGATSSNLGTVYPSIQFQYLMVVGPLASAATIGNNVGYLSGNYKYLSSQPASFYGQNYGSSAHVFYSAASGTAGNTITFTPVLAVDKGKSLALEGATSQTGTGITFPATQSASSDANTLDDYEEGTWTPVLTDGTNNATSNAETAGIYVKIGRTVYITATMYTTSLGSVSGTVYVSGLPFASANQDPKISLSIGYAALLNISANQVISAWIQANESRIRLSLWDSTGGVTALQASEWSADGLAFITGTYYV